MFLSDFRWHIFIALFTPLLVIVFLSAMQNGFWNNFYMYCCILLNYINVLFNFCINFMRFGDFKVV
jgi:hypothetical protein